MSAIICHSLRKSYDGTDIIPDLDLQVRSGEFIVILGPSGCGKSTLLRMIAGLEEVTGGTIEIAGRDVTTQEPRARDCAMVFQNYALYPHMSVAQNIGYALKIARVPRAQRDRRVRETAALVGLEAFLERKPGQLSGGQRQRVAMARAIIRDPGVFLFDEPLSNLDASLRGQMRHEIRRIHDRTGASSVFVTHDQHEAMTLGDRMVVMNNGRIEQIGTPREVYARPATVFVAEFIGSPPMSLLPAEANQASGVLQFSDGSTLRVEDAVLSACAGRDLRLGLRAEEVTFCPIDTADLVARFDFFEERGHEGLHCLRFGAGPLAVLSRDKHRLAQGAEVGLRVPSNAIHIFDADTGCRIDTHIEKEAAA